MDSSLVSDKNCKILYLSRAKLGRAQTNIKNGVISWKPSPASYRLGNKLDQRARLIIVCGGILGVVGPFYLEAVPLGSPVLWRENAGGQSSTLMVDGLLE